VHSLLPEFLPSRVALRDFLLLFYRGVFELLLLFQLRFFDSIIRLRGILLEDALVLLLALGGDWGGAKFNFIKKNVKF
jgi:hypothetical protein